jgi:hypothetical protein
LRGCRVTLSRARAAGAEEPSNGGSIDIDKVNGAVRQLPELVQIIAAVDDARIDERRVFGWHAGSYPALSHRVNDWQPNDGAE